MRKPYLVLLLLVVVAGVTAQIILSRITGSSPVGDVFAAQQEEARSQKSGARSQEPEVRSQESGVRSQESGVRSQKPEVASQKPEVASLKPEVASPKPEVASPKPAAASPKPAVTTPKPEVASQNPDSSLIPHPSSFPTGPVVAEEKPGDTKKKSHTPVIEVRLRNPDDDSKTEDASHDPHDEKLAQLADEVEKMRTDLLRLQQTFDMYAGNQIADLKTENERLRKEVARLYEKGKMARAQAQAPTRSQAESGNETDGVPTPNKALIEGILADSAAQGAAPDEAGTQESGDRSQEPGDANQEMEAGNQQPDSSLSKEDEVLKEVARWRAERESGKQAASDNKKGRNRLASKVKAKTSPDDQETAPVHRVNNKEGYEAVAEWGRTPEDAETLKKPEVSLKGMICVVNPGTDDGDLTVLGRKLRNEYDKYNNINIEVFDDFKAAQAFNKGQDDPDHHVLSVSKHAATKRDVILLMRGENKLEISREEPGEPPTKTSKN